MHVLIYVIEVETGPKWVDELLGSNRRCGKHLLGAAAAPMHCVPGLQYSLSTLHCARLLCAPYRTLTFTPRSLYLALERTPESLRMPELRRSVVELQQPPEEALIISRKGVKYNGERRLREQIFVLIHCYREEKPLSVVWR